MSDLLQFIVEKLNEPPFKKGLSLVTFDEKAPNELLEVLNDVFVALDAAHKVDLRDEPPAQTGARMCQMLQVCKYTLPADDLEGFKEALLAGDRGVIYPILHYLLSKLPQLQKRAYLARFLVNIEIPPEFMHDEVVQDVFGTYKELQGEFKETHKTVDRLVSERTKVRGNTLAPGELKREIDQLEEERTQLTEKISQLKRKTTGMDGFAELLEATSNLRREQEEEAKLQERMHEQRMNRNASEKRYSEATRRLTEVRASTKEDVSAEQLLEQVQRDFEENRRLAADTLPSTIAARRETLEALNAKLSEPSKGEGDVRGLEAEVRSLNGEIEHLTKSIAAAQKAAGDDKLALFRQQSALVAKKLAQKEEAYDDLAREKEELAREIEDKEAKMGEMTGPKFMKREEFKQYASQLRNKTNKFKKMKAELADIRAETVVVSRTVQILRGLDESLGEVLERLERERGVEGYTKTESKLVEASEKTEELDHAKGKTLEEISRIVTDITTQLKERKNQLAPQIKSLRQVRQQYQELESRYLGSKGKFENTAAGLEAERIKLEQECGQYQEECLREESRYHYLNSLMAILEGQQRRVAEETKFSRGEGSLLRDFRTWRELYTHKVQQQEQLSKELRKQQKAVKENEGPNMAQRKLFTDVKRLLELKLRLSNEEAKAKAADDMGGATVATFDAVDFGGANVMRIED